MIEIFIGICIAFSGAVFLAQKIVVKKVEESWKHLPDAGAYRTATTFKETAITTKGVMGVKMREPMKFSTKKAIALIWNSVFLSAMVMAAGIFWGAMSLPLACASVFVIIILSVGSFFTSGLLIQ